MSSNKPVFLVVGAMKAATTTLFEDLSKHPGIFAPLEKEPGHLSSDEIFIEDCWDQYLSLFSKAHPGQMCFEASTYYTMRPENEGAADRAYKLLGEDLKIIYLIREPVQRTISHHAHAHARGDCCGDINKSIVTLPRLINYSKYFYQIEPWIEAFGSDNIFILTQDYYINNRKEAVSAIQVFLGLKPFVDQINEKWIGNRRSSLTEDTHISKLIRGSAFYKRAVRKLVNTSTRNILKAFFMRRISRPVESLNEEMHQFILSETRADMEKIAPYIRLKEPEGWV
jgi:hypothetical protein